MSKMTDKQFRELIEKLEEIRCGIIDVEISMSANNVSEETEYIIDYIDAETIRLVRRVT